MMCLREWEVIDVMLEDCEILLAAFEKAFSSQVLVIMIRIRYFLYHFSLFRTPVPYNYEQRQRKMKKDWNCPQEALPYFSS